MPGESSSVAFSYAILRVMPSLARGEQINAGVVLHCRQRGFLAARVAVDRDRLAALAPELSADAVHAQLEAIARIAAGEPGAGPIAALPQPERFGWIVAPSSTSIQASPAHTGLTGDPATELDELFRELVV